MIGVFLRFIKKRVCQYRSCGLADFFWERERLTPPLVGQKPVGGFGSLGRCNGGNRAKSYWVASAPSSERSIADRIKLENETGICYAKCMTEQEKLSTLYEYASGHLGTRTAIEQLGMKDYADLIIALSAHDLALPKPPMSPTHLAHRERARAILQPRLRNGA